MHAFFGEVFARRVQILGRYPQSCSPAYSGFVIEVVAYRNHHAAAGDMQIQWLIKPRTAMFQQHILAGDTHIRGAVLYISRHVRSPHDDKPYIIAVGGEDQFTRGLGIIQRDNTRRFQ